MNSCISVVSMGAVPNTPELQTDKFQKALDAVFFNGGGTVEIPSGEWRIGTVRVRSNTTLLLRSGAVIKGDRDPESYTQFKNDIVEPLPHEVLTDKTWEPTVKGKERDYGFLLAGGRWNNAIIRIAYASNVSIVGEEGSVIDGCDCYDALGEEQYRGPHGISVHFCHNIRLSGYSIQNTGNWAHSIWYSDNIHAEHITVLGGHDGIHMTRCENIRVDGCNFYTGDDCVAGFGNLNTYVTGCIMNTACSALRFGGTNVLVENCHFYGPAQYFFRGSLTLEEKISGAKAHIPHRTNMLSVFTYYADFSVEIPVQPDNIMIKDCTVSNVDRFLHYNFSGNERWQANRPLRSICFDNIKAEKISMPLTAYGAPDVPLLLTVKNSSIAFDEDAPSVSLLHTAYFERITLEALELKAVEPAPLIKSWTVGGETVINNVSGNFKQETEYTDQPFKCKTI